MAQPLRDPKMILDAKLTDEGKIVLSDCPYKTIPWDVVQASVAELIAICEHLHGELDYYEEAYGSQS